ncbi:MAG: T9SS type A sorting domain-containing protein [Bacteroidia bacterium]|nr:T9SS type A sorting domain-containing protein [Bacteroidia bacterium]MBT8276701.1 T9SS type A sorting domain-containing protein [Bacteroidia bacterium]NNF32238.1 T9SS type A sorting domain-containing protein [Flavobacteriaceae bacterium]NNJ81086.1 T9SS type A sorting domain-containing protein [Flavobacteriaceae bacterium]NNK55159.1 T9SS type A sorting domain-containing protein [Flavobacteriaceae bacterium]
MKKPLILLLMGIFISHISTYSQSHTWNGNGGDNDWFNPSNWIQNSVPDASSDVLISSDAEVEIFIGTAEANQIQIENNSTLTLDNTLELGSEMNIGALGTFVFMGGTFSGGTIENNGLIRFESLTVKTVINATLNNNQLFEVNNSNQIQLNNVEINNSTGAIIDIASVGGFLSQGGNPSVLNNEGFLNKLPDGVNPNGNFYVILNINNTGVIDIPENETLLCLGGNITLNNLNTGLIRGKGTFDITANFNNSGLVAPGGEGVVGTFHITNIFNLSPPGALLIDIGAEASEHDVIEIFGSPQLEGDIFVECQATLSVGDEFPIITATQGIGTCNFPQFVYADLFASSYEFEVICDPDTVYLKFVREVILNNEDFTSGDIDFYTSPNPAKDIIEVILPSELFQLHQSLEIDIINAVGQQIDVLTISTEKQSFDTSNLTSGIYFLILKTKGRRLSTTKMVKL